MAAAVPFIPTAVSIIGGLFAKKKGLGGPNAAEKASMGGVMNQAGQLGQQGDTLFRYGNPLLNQSASYYQRLLGGSRASMMQAIHPETSAITDAYRGAERSLERSNVRGASRDMAMAELNRDRAGKVAGALMDVRPKAASALSDLGQFGTSEGMRGTQASGGLYGSLLNPQGQQRRDQNQVQSDFGKSLGSLTADVMKAWKSKQDSKKGIV